MKKYDVLKFLVKDEDKGRMVNAGDRITGNIVQLEVGKSLLVFDEENNKELRTSQVISINKMEKYMVIETKNSYYMCREV